MSSVSPPGPLDLSELQHYLRASLPGWEGATIDSIAQSWPGLSRETWFIAASCGDQAAPRRCVLRIDTDAPGIALTPLSYEVAIHQRLSETEVPVAPVLAYEDAGAAFTNGRPFYIRAWIDGTVEPPGLRDQGPASDGLRIAVARELVRVLGAVHALDWRGLRFDAFMRVPTSPALAAHEYVELQISHLHSLDIEANPVVLECLLALRDAPPPPPSAICLTKGNLGIGDEIWVDAKIAATCDWESAALGDPALDLATCRRHLDWLWNMEEALEFYRECTGRTVHLSAIDYYARLWAARGCIVAQAGLRGFSTGAEQRLQLAVLGLGTGYSNQSNLARSTGF